MSGNTSSDIWIAGAVAAFTVDLLVYPLDTLKTRIQSPDYRRLYLHESTNTLNKAALFRGLYQGLTSVVIATLPASGAFFTTYEGSKSALQNHAPFKALPSPVIHASASALAELVACAIITPAEVIKQNAQMVSQASIARNAASATQQTLQRFRKNPLALWRGYSALAGRNLPFTALQFPMYEHFKLYIKAWREDSRDAPARKAGDVSIFEDGVITAVSAGSAGAIAAVVTTPIDVVKTRIMLAAATSFADQDTPGKALNAAKEGKVTAAIGAVSESISKGAHKKLSSMQIARDIVAERGWRGLWRGGALRGVWTMLGSGLYLSAYESGRVYLARRRGNAGNIDVED